MQFLVDYRSDSTKMHGVTVRFIVPSCSFNFYDVWNVYKYQYFKMYYSASIS